jgi:hypothetical protein
MQNVMEVKGTYRSFDERMTNVLNMHTYTTHGSDPCHGICREQQADRGHW